MLFVFSLQNLLHELFARPLPLRFFCRPSSPSPRWRPCSGSRSKTENTSLRSPPLFFFLWSPLFLSCNPRKSPGVSLNHLLLHRAVISTGTNPTNRTGFLLSSWLFPSAPPLKSRWAEGVWISGVVDTSQGLSCYTVELVFTVWLVLKTQTLISLPSPLGWILASLTPSAHVTPLTFLRKSDFILSFLNVASQEPEWSHILWRINIYKPRVSSCARSLCVTYMWLIVVMNRSPTQTDPEPRTSVSA